MTKMNGAQVAAERGKARIFFNLLADKSIAARLDWKRFFATKPSAAFLAEVGACHERHVRELAAS